MPYIAIKAFPKDEATKRAFVEKVNEALLQVWGCPQGAVTISLEEVSPADWEEKVRKTEIEPKTDRMMILSGKKLY